jgi:hypothetical protein
MEKLQHDNAQHNIAIKDITPLIRKRQDNKVDESIVVFTDDVQAANNCIKRGFYINCERKFLERYCPHLRITQCFKCHNYGHQATQCKHTKRCGNCGDEGHNTNECHSGEAKCVHCNKAHPAWHHECATRKAESQRLNEMKKNTSPYFAE